MRLTCKSCEYCCKVRTRLAKYNICAKRHIRISLRRKYCELYEPK